MGDGCLEEGVAVTCFMSDEGWTGEGDKEGKGDGVESGRVISGEHVHCEEFRNGKLMMNDGDRQ